eukprot:1196006-Prorocentrum_minimum.AAC.4
MPNFAEELVANALALEKERRRKEREEWQEWQRCAEGNGDESSLAPSTRFIPTLKPTRFKPPTSTKLADASDPSAIDKDEDLGLMIEVERQRMMAEVRLMREQILTEVRNAAGAADPGNALPASFDLKQDMQDRLDRGC